MQEEEIKPGIKRFFEHFGFTVEDIFPDSKTKKPDFRVHNNSETHLVELKIKDDDPKKIGAEVKILNQGEIAGRVTPISPRNTLSGIIDNGVKQLAEINEYPRTFRILWIHSTGTDPELLNERFKSTLYGSATLCTLDPPPLLTCYYYHESAFFKHCDSLNAAILSYNDQISMCVNSLATSIEAFRASELYSQLDRAVIDPPLQENLKNGIIIADCKIDRKFSNKITEYLRTKYELNHLQYMPMNRFYAAKKYPDDINISS